MTNSLKSNAATVLVADDIAANRNLLREILEPIGYEILLAGDGEAALKIAARETGIDPPGRDDAETGRF